MNKVLSKYNKESFPKETIYDPQPTRCAFTATFIRHIYGAEGPDNRIDLDNYTDILDPQPSVLMFDLGFKAVLSGHVWCVVKTSDKWYLFESYAGKKDFYRKEISPSEVKDLVDKCKKFVQDPSEELWYGMFGVYDCVFTKEDIHYYGWDIEYDIQDSGYSFEITSIPLNDSVWEQFCRLLKYADDISGEEMKEVITTILPDLPGMLKKKLAELEQ